MSEQSNRYIDDLRNDAHQEGYDEGYLQGKLAACQDCTRMGILSSPPRFITVTIPGQHSGDLVIHVALDKVAEVEVQPGRAGNPLVVTINYVGGGCRSLTSTDAMLAMLVALGAEALP